MLKSMASAWRRIRLKRDVSAVLKSGGIDPSVLPPAFIDSRVTAGLYLGFSAAEIVAFMYQEWPEDRPASEAAASFTAAAAQVHQGRARRVVVLHAMRGTHLIEAATLAALDPDGRMVAASIFSGYPPSPRRRENHYSD